MQILHAALRFMCMIIDFMSNLLQQTHKADNTDFLSKHTTYLEQKETHWPTFWLKILLTFEFEIGISIKGSHHIQYKVYAVQVGHLGEC